MASKSSDHTHHKSVCKTGRASPGKPDADAQEFEDENTASAKEEELLELLEELSETLDAAQDALTEKQSLSSTELHSEAEPAPEEHSRGFKIPIPPSFSPIGKSTFIGKLSTAFGLFFGIASLAVFWLFWNSPDSPGKIKLAADQNSAVSNVAAPAQKVGINADPAADLMAKPSSSPQILASTSPNPPLIIQEPVELKSEEPVELKSDVSGSPVVAIEKTLAPAPSAPAPLGETEEKQLMIRGQALISAGDIAGARLAFEYAAHRGSADAMYALAQTYDVEMLNIWNVFGIKPDARTALKWYGRAAQKGHDQADARASELEKLTENRP